MRPQPVHFIASLRCVGVIALTGRVSMMSSSRRIKLVSIPKFMWRAVTPAAVSTFAIPTQMTCGFLESNADRDWGLGT